VDKKRYEDLVLEPAFDRVDKGARFLDKKVPGWHKKIGTVLLNLADFDHCILGQLFPSFGTGMKRLGLTLPHKKNVDLRTYSGNPPGGIGENAKMDYVTNAILYGFSPPPDVRSNAAHSYDAHDNKLLNKWWTAEVLDRRMRDVRMEALALQSAGPDAKPAKKTRPAKKPTPKTRKPQAAR
jgi:hypothetical protein